MMNKSEVIQNNNVIRTKQGLFVAGTRITVYDIMDYLKDGWPPHLIRKWLNLSEAQINNVMEYIENNREAVESEYQLVLKETEEIQKYWDDRNRERFAQIATKPPKPEQEKIRKKLQAWKAKLDQK